MIQLNLKRWEKLKTFSTSFSKHIKDMKMEKLPIISDR